MNNKIILSIVIPTKNRAKLLKTVLESIEGQKADQNVFEVIIIDNGSTDETKDVAKEYQEKIKNCRYYFDARPGLHVGRNRGMLESRGELVGYLDDDVILFPNWINTVLTAFEDKKVMYVGGSVIHHGLFPPLVVSGKLEYPRMIQGCTECQSKAFLGEIVYIGKAYCINAGDFIPMGCQIIC